MNQLKTGQWNLTDLKDVKPNGKTVFSCFHCGGGSTMGYKLAGYDVLGGVEIDPEMMSIYRSNHHPKHSYLMGVQEFKNIPNESLPSELFNLDILDGSPPCSSFSMAGSREDAWGKNKKFREGQANQVLDDLFFHFIDIAAKLKPKVVVAENVKGLVIGKAKGYVKMIVDQFDKAGYDVQLFLLNSAFMGVPQKRERTFFIAKRKDLNFSKLKLMFDETPITIKTATQNVLNKQFKPITESTKMLWAKCKQGKSLRTVHLNGSRFNWSRENINQPCRTFVSTSSNMILHPTEPRPFYDGEKIRIQTFPDDYNFLKSDVGYVCGMSVPPFMMQRVANQIYKQWLKNM